MRLGPARHLYVVSIQAAIYVSTNKKSSTLNKRFKPVGWSFNLTGTQKSEMKLFWKPLIETKGKKSRQNFDEYHLNAPEMELKEVSLTSHNKLDLKKMQCCQDSNLCQCHDPFLCYNYAMPLRKYKLFGFLNPGIKHSC